MTRRRRLLARAAAVALAAFVAIQFVPLGGRGGNRNPPVTAAVEWPSPAAERLARAACYDCHSNETEWPWYSRVAPASWLVWRDVRAGRDELNLSEPEGVEDASDDDLVESIEDGSMPPRQYLLAHPDARLSETEKATLVGALRSLGADGDESDGGRGRGRGRGGDG